MDLDYTVIAQEAYDAYGAVTDHKNYQGLPMPTWDELGGKIQSAWIAAVKQAVATANKLNRPY